MEEHSSTQSKSVGEGSTAWVAGTQYAFIASVDAACCVVMCVYNSVFKQMTVERKKSNLVEILCIETVRDEDVDDESATKTVYVLG